MKRVLRVFRVSKVSHSKIILEIAMYLRFSRKLKVEPSTIYINKKRQYIQVERVIRVARLGQISPPNLGRHLAGKSRSIWQPWS